MTLSVSLLCNPLVADFKHTVCKPLCSAEIVRLSYSHPVCYSSSLIICRSTGCSLTSPEVIRALTSSVNTQAGERVSVCTHLCVCVDISKLKKFDFGKIVCECVRDRHTEALYIFTRPVIRRLCLQEPPNTKCVWVAASGDKMAISTISQPQY